MTRDRGYPDWLVLSARLLLQPRLKIVQNIYVLVVFGYVRILQPVAICRPTVIFVTVSYCYLGKLEKERQKPVYTVNFN